MAMLADMKSMFPIIFHFIGKLWLTPRDHSFSFDTQNFPREHIKR
jgi:hypothetical protein